LLEMCFTQPGTGITMELGAVDDDLVEILFSENPGIIFQTSAEDEVLKILTQRGVKAQILGHVSLTRKISIHHSKSLISFDIDELRDIWFKTSFLLDAKQRPATHAEK